jgi:HK97 family phage portal protein
MSLFSRIVDRAKGKDLYDLHPELQHRIPIMRVLSGSEQGAGSANFAGNAGFYQTQVWTNKAIKVLKDAIAPLFIRVITGVGEDVEVVDNHEFTELLQAPNPEQDAASFWEEWVVDQMLGGEWGIEVVRNEAETSALELWPRQPNVFELMPDETRQRYRTVAAYKIDDGTGEPYELKPDEFIHIKFYNPLNPWRGLAPITAVRMGIVIDQLAQSWTRLFFRNQARPDYALIAPEGLTGDERKEYQNQLMSDYGDAEGLHRPIILEDGVTDIKTFSFAPKDLEWLEQRKLSRDEIGGIFGVPDEIMGYGRDTYENFDTADRVLWTLTIVPLVKFRDRNITGWAKRHKIIETDQRIETDLSAIPQLQSDQTAKIGQLKTLAEKGYPVNSLNEWLGLGLPEVSGGDIGYIPFNMVPVGTERPQVQRQSRAINKQAAPEFGSPEHEALWKQKQARLDKPAADMQRQLKRFIQEQQNEVTRLLRASNDYGRGQWVKEPDSIPSPADLFDIEKWIEAFKKLFLPVIGRAVELIGNYELESLGIGLVFDASRPEVISGIEHVLNTVAIKTNDTTWNGLVDLFQEAEEAGEGISAIQERLSAYFGDRKSDWQTERIARTTMTGASGHGGDMAMQQAEDETGMKAVKTWLSALIPGRTRPDHAAAHGQVRQRSEMYDVGGEKLQYPGDPNGSPGNIINCLCDQIFELKE